MRFCSKVELPVICSYFTNINIIIDYQGRDDLIIFLPEMSEILISDYFYWAARYFRMKMAIRNNTIVITDSDGLSIIYSPRNEDTKAINELQNEHNYPINCHFCGSPIYEEVAFLSELFSTNVIIDSMNDEIYEHYVGRCYLYGKQNLYEYCKILCLETASYLVFTHGLYVITNDKCLITNDNILYNPFQIKGTKYSDEVSKKLIGKKILHQNNKEFYDYSFEEFDGEIFNHLNIIERIFNTAIITHSETMNRIDREPRKIRASTGAHAAFKEILDAYQLECIYTDKYLFLYDPTLVTIELIEEPINDPDVKEIVDD